MSRGGILGPATDDDGELTPESIANFKIERAKLLSFEDAEAEFTRLYGPLMLGTKH